VFFGHLMYRGPCTIHHYEVSKGCPVRCPVYLVTPCHPLRMLIPFHSLMRVCYVRILAR
jgi:hypothetical protein